MTRYHCPFCSPRYQIHIERSDGVMICGQCGDPLNKLPFIKATQVFAFIVASVFVTPLIVMLFAFFHDSYRSQPKRPLLSKAVILKSINVLLVERWGVLVVSDWSFSLPLFECALDHLFICKQSLNFVEEALCLIGGFSCKIQMCLTHSSLFSD